MKHWAKTQTPHRCQVCGKWVTKFKRKDLSETQRVVLGHNNYDNLFCPGSREIVEETHDNERAKR